MRKIDIQCVNVTDRGYNLSKSEALRLAEKYLGRSLEPLQTFRSGDQEPKWVFIIRDMSDFMDRCGFDYISIEACLGDLREGTDGPWTF